jgi:putative Holliday junction resolvase
MLPTTTMAKGRLLGIDFGTVRVGLAVSDPDRRIASPLATYERRDAEQDAHYFNDLIKTEDIRGLVIGLPVHLSGSEGASAQAARKFGQWLKDATGMDCVFWDERFTSVEAESSLWQAGLTHKKRKQRRDRVAAQMLLQSYLDAGCPPEVSPGPLHSEPAP